MVDGSRPRLNRMSGSEAWREVLRSWFRGVAQSAASVQVIEKADIA